MCPASSSSLVATPWPPFWNANSFNFTGTSHQGAPRSETMEQYAQWAFPVFQFLILLILYDTLHALHVSTYILPIFTNISNIRNIAEYIPYTTVYRNCAWYHWYQTEIADTIPSPDTKNRKNIENIWILWIWIIAIIANNCESLETSLPLASLLFWQLHLQPKCSGTSLQSPHWLARSSSMVPHSAANGKSLATFYWFWRSSGDE